MSVGSESCLSFFVGVENQKWCVQLDACLQEIVLELPLPLEVAGVLSFAQRVTALRGSAAVGIAEIKGHPTNFVFNQGQVLSADKVSNDLPAAAADSVVASRWIP